jgi:DNA-binding transcriptional LysR family regulator
MRLRHIEVFHAVYSSGSVSRAARLLNVSQPSISKVLAHAEQQLGYPLFDRVKGKLIPTPEADLLFEHARTVNDQLDRLRSMALNLREADQGVLRIAAIPAFGIELLPRAVAQWQKDHPKTFFAVETLHYGEICRSLLDGKLDIGLVFDHSPVPLLAEDALAEGRFYAIAHEHMDFGIRETLSLADLARQPFIELDSRGPLGRRLFEHTARSGVELNLVARCETYQMAKALVACGAGVSVIDEVTARSGDPRGIQFWPLEPEATFRISALHWGRVPLSQLGHRFLAHLQCTIREFLHKP